MPTGVGDAPWLDVAWRELGVAERAGPAAEPRVIGYYRDAGHGEVTDDGVPWCAAFVGACLKRTGAVVTGSLMARSYARTGRELKEPRLGALAILSRGTDPAAGHVGFVVGWSASGVILLGGNQGDAVSIGVFDRSRIVALRWPDMTNGGTVARPAEPSEPVAAGDPPPPSPPPPPPPLMRPGPSSGSTLFQLALAHVLAMEGGFTDDRFDPGGATNFGITITDYAAWRGEDLTADNHGRLRAELRTIAPQTVEAIYLKRYWGPSRAGELPPPIALMHFDCAVNQGIGGAARLLQAALGVAVDGEIGPVTLAAATACDVASTITRYAELRRQRYRALATFWRFGRGWLARVDATATAATRLIPNSSFRSQTMETPMAETSSMTPAASRTPVDAGVLPAKWWGHSMTIWGAAITAAATVLPALGPVLRPVIGIDLTPDIVRQTTADVVQITQALAGVAGTVMTIVGRLRAASRLEARALTLRI